MSSAAGGSGDAGGHPSKGKRPLGSNTKANKPGAFERAMLRFLQKEHEKCVARGEEPPFGGRYAPPSTAVVQAPPADCPPNASAKDPAS